MALQSQGAFQIQSCALSSWNNCTHEWYTENNSLFMCLRAYGERAVEKFRRWRISMLKHNLSSVPSTHGQSFMQRGASLLHWERAQRQHHQPEAHRSARLEYTMYKQERPCLTHNSLHFPQGPVRGKHTFWHISCLHAYELGQRWEWTPSKIVLCLPHSCFGMSPWTCPYMSIHRNK